MFDVQIDAYATLNSPLHKLDPRMKLVSGLILIFSIVLLYDIRAAFLGLLSAFAIVFISKIPLLSILRRLRAVSIFIAVTVIVLMFSAKGTAVAAFGVFEISREGLVYGGLVGLRAFSAIILIFPIIGTMRFDVFIKALESLHVPNKLVQIIAFAYRYIFVFIQESNRVFISIESRGFGKKRKSILTSRIIGDVVGMLVVRSYERADRVYKSMLTRGYTGKMKTLITFNIKSMDCLKAACIVGMAAILQVFSITKFIGVTI